jgi:hypothetical protein
VQLLRLIVVFSTGCVQVEFPPALDPPSMDTIITIAEGAVRSTLTSVVFASGSTLLQPRMAPLSLVSAVFDNTGTSIVVTFDREGPGAFLPSTSTTGTKPSRSLPCAAVFSNSNLGPGAVCTWTSPKQLTVALGPYQSAVGRVGPMQPFDSSFPCSRLGAASSLTLLPGVVRNFAGGIVSAAGCVAVAPPVSPPVPRIVLQGPQLVGPCNPIVMDASGSSGGAGAPLSFSWTLVPTNSVATAAPSAQLIASADGVLRIDGGGLPPGSAWTVNVQGTNVLGGSGAASVPLTVALLAIPVMEVDGSASRSV